MPSGNEIKMICGNSGDRPSSSCDGSLDLHRGSSLLCLLNVQHISPQSTTTGNLNL